MKPDKNYFLTRFKQVGSAKFMMELQEHSLEEIVNPESDMVHLELQKVSAYFWTEFRKTNSEQYRELAIIFRRVANLVYRELRRKNRTKYNSNFFNSLKGFK